MCARHRLPRMFTGIIRDIGCVRAIEKVDGGDVAIAIATQLDLTQTEIGASIACDGVCLTVVEKGSDWFRVEVSAETLSKTAMGSWAEGLAINLEPALKMGDELGGHIVSGHVDGLARIEEITPDGGSYRLRLRAPDELTAYIAPKGSVALDGVSLTVNEVQGAHFGVNIIPHTWGHTALSAKQVGDNLHLEVDMLARYVARILERQVA